MSNKCSPQHAAKSNKRVSVSRSTNPSFIAAVASAIFLASATRASSPVPLPSRAPPADDFASALAINARFRS